ncbi:derlin-1 [Biomphalaria glabrata]|uniref:Derlin n=2 Tax=Biomphalaria TaxID=6525 RepID=A0A9U8ENL8_BIOGL|nr:derlin-1-like [Biomphalaria glabrata]KAI8790762.1 derlin-1 [Biomphalaria glabrata]KAK0042921.1 derlin-1 [Biomphalaria pfeifferi]
MASNDIGDWYRSIPQISKYWFTGSVVVPLIGRLGLISPLRFLLDFNSLIYRFQIWRPITAVLFYPISGPKGFHYLMNLYFLYTYSTRLETDTFSGSPADYAFMLIFNWICLVIIGLVAELPLLMDPMVLSVLYVWCQLNKDQVISFWFGTRFKAMYLPWVLFAFNLIIGSGGMMELFGIVVGHLYFFLMFKYPQDFGGAQLLSVPNILYKWFPRRQGGSGGFGQAPPVRRRPDNGGNDGGGWRGHNWGAGHQLGGN